LTENSIRNNFSVAVFLLQHQQAMRERIAALQTQSRDDGSARRNMHVWGGARAIGRVQWCKFA
jgi:hypothetical protein